MIFDLLGPASQRILAATCKSLFEVWKKHIKDGCEKGIRIHVDELFGHTTEAFEDIFYDWVDAWKSMKGFRAKDIRDLEVEINWAFCKHLDLVENGEDTNDKRTTRSRRMNYGNRILQCDRQRFCTALKLHRTTRMKTFLLGLRILVTISAMKMTMMRRTRLKYMVNWSARNEIKDELATTALPIELPA